LMRNIIIENKNAWGQQGTWICKTKLSIYNF